MQVVNTRMSYNFNLSLLHQDVHRQRRHVAAVVNTKTLAHSGRFLGLPHGTSKPRTPEFPQPNLHHTSKSVPLYALCEHLSLEGGAVTA